MDAFQLTFLGSTIFGIGWILLNQSRLSKDQLDTLTALNLLTSRQSSSEKALSDQLNILLLELKQMRAAYDCEEADISDIRGFFPSIFEILDRHYKHIAAIQADGVDFKDSQDRIDKDINELAGEINDLRTRLESAINLLTSPPELPPSSDEIVQPEPKKRPSGGIKWGKGLKQ